jgi:hypothetical protein
MAARTGFSLISLFMGVCFGDQFMFVKLRSIVGSDLSSRVNCFFCFSGQLQSEFFFPDPVWGTPQTGIFFSYLSRIYQLNLRTNH